MKYIDLYRPVYSIKGRHYSLYYTATKKQMANILILRRDYPKMLEDKLVDGLVELCKVDGYKNIPKDIKPFFKLGKSSYIFYDTPDIRFESILVTLLKGCYYNNISIRFKKNINKLQEEL